MFSMLKVTHQKWISDYIQMRGWWDPLLPLRNVCVGEVWDSQFIDIHIQVLLCLKVSAILVVWWWWLWGTQHSRMFGIAGLHGVNVNAQIIIILRWEQSPKGTFRTTLLNPRVPCLLLELMCLAEEGRREAGGALWLFNTAFVAA